MKCTSLHRWKQTLLVVLIFVGALMVPVLPARALFGVGDTVFDLAAQIERITEHTAVIAEWGKNLAALNETITQVSAVVAAVKNPQTVIDLALKKILPEEAQLLPPEYQEAAQRLNSAAGSYVAFWKQITGLQEKITNMTTERFKDPNSAGAKAWKASLDQKLASQATDRAVYEQAGARIPEIAEIIKVIGQSNLKGAVDHGNLIKAQQLRLDNMQIQLKALRELDEQAIANIRRKERERRISEEEKGPVRVEPIKWNWRMEQ